MVVVAKPAQPDAVEVTIAITMTAGKWRELLAQMDRNRFPSWEVASAIHHAVKQFSETQVPMAWPAGSGE